MSSHTMLMPSSKLASLMAALMMLMLIVVFHGQPALGQSTCQGGWTMGPSGKCLKLVSNWANPANSQGFTWPAAEIYCQKLAQDDGNHDGHLVSIHNQAENNFVQTMLQNNVPAGPQIYWLGLTLERAVVAGFVNNTVAAYRWTDQSAYNYNAFNPPPSNSGGGQATGEYCVNMDVAGVWNDLNCQIWGIGNPGPNCCTPWMGAVCQAKPGLACNNGGMTGGTAPKCADGWYSFVGATSCYRAFPPTALNAYNFNQAEANCVGLGGHLASIHTDAEMKYVTGLYNAASVPAVGPAANTFFWLGGQMNGLQLANWTDSSPVDYKGQWQAGEPNGDLPLPTCAHGYSVIVNQASTIPNNGNWNDLPCAWNQLNDGVRGGYVCKRPAP